MTAPTPDAVLGSSAAGHEAVSGRLRRLRDPADQDGVAASRFLQKRRPGLDPVWLGGDARGGRRVNTFLSGGSRHYDLLREIDGRFVPEVLSTYPHIPFAKAHVNAKPPPDGETSVFVCVEDVFTPDASEATFMFGGARLDVAVIGGPCTLVA